MAKIGKITHFFTRAALFLAAAALWPALPAAAQQQELIRTVVIDPGHGGKDPGSVHPGGKHYEKDIVLKVALKFGRLIHEKYPNVKVIYTRTTDVFVPVDVRGKIANDAEADLFFSIHTNSNAGKAGTGTETLVMGLSKSSQALEAAMRENDVVSLEADYSTRYNGYEPGSAESFIIFNLMQFAYREQSLALAQCVQNSYREHFSLVDRGVKESPVLVLWAPAMPSILTEMGFINNNNDLKGLISDEGQDKYARALFNAFSEYKTRTESRSGIAVAPPASQPRTAPAAEKPAVETPASGLRSPVSEQSAAAPSLFFSVQVGAFPRRVSPNDPVFGAYRGKVFEKQIAPYYKYYVGQCTTYAEAAKLQDEVVRRLGECFIVAFRDGRQIAVSEAVKLLR